MFRAVLARGRVAPSGDDAQCLLVGNGGTPGKLLRKIFSNDVEILEKKRIPARRLKDLFGGPSQHTDLIVADLPLRYDDVFRPLSTFRARKRVRQVVDISGSRFEENRKLQDKMRETLRKIRRQGYEPRLSRSDADLRYFYDRMFVPHTLARYGDLASIEGFPRFREQFEDGALLFVVASGAAVAGALVRFCGTRLEYRRMGVLDGDRAHVTNGAQSAVYYYMLRHAKDEGFKSVDFLMSVAYLDDGVYVAKRDWGADALVDGTDDDTRLYYFNRPGSTRLGEIYARILPIVEEEGNLAGVVGALDGGDARRDLVKKYGGQGVRRILTLGSDGMIRSQP